VKSNCERCGEMLYFHERHGGAFLCRECATVAGVVRTCDPPKRKGARR
jgi:late competence protein required for DNA uptake (superfamily II DNA/RNA helicase)